ncbi:Uncharacterized membrane protein [Halogranum amylolyticum]|uniref:Uncharacterized membrane protein n=1 Tax=Halogranum amylolyticum TaxID=660520 RepID=A0A1H8UJT0_9EURY|nr:glutamine amidotransferase [Halogranum amylolyticum]SEP03124.1 Uncharacterized membrane protein [Halogranum amylolyticum]
MADILLAGESWVTVQFEIKGRNVLRDASYGEAADRYIETLETIGHDVTFQPCHVATQEFPRTREQLDAYDLVVLSDIGADTLQVTPQVAAGKTDADRLTVLAEWVRDGGALGMIGGYMSFGGKGGQARYANTPLSDVLPVEISAGDDRVETPAGATPQNQGVPNADLPTEWPHVLGYNRVRASEEAEVWATVQENPFIVCDDADAGRVFTYTTDCAPHWAPEAFLEWEQLPTLWNAIIEWALH